MGLFITGFFDLPDLFCQGLSCILVEFTQFQIVFTALAVKHISMHCLKSKELFCHFHFLQLQWSWSAAKGPNVF